MFEILTLPFFQRAIIVGLIIGCIMAILGVFVILRNMSFFSDAIGHSALTGIAIALLLGYSPFWGALIFAILIALGISLIRANNKISLDTTLGVLFSASVALGVILTSLSPGYQADLISFLFGNILTVNSRDIIASLILASVTIITLLWVGKGFVAISLDTALAKAEGIPVARYERIFLVLLAINIALAIKFVGVILVTALIIVPAASAQNIARSLSTMFILSTIFGLLAVVIGLLASAALNLPSGPTIVLTSSSIFALTFLSGRFLKVQI